MYEYFPIPIEHGYVMGFVGHYSTASLAILRCFFVLIHFILDCTKYITTVRNILPRQRESNGFSTWRAFAFYLTIRLRARDFYAVIVDEGEARINYHHIEIESE